MSWTLHSDQGTQVVVSGLETDSDAIEASMALLSADERLRADRFVFDADRHRFVAARARLRELLGQRLDVRPESVELTYGDQGKPALAPRFAGSALRFNVSHSQHHAVFAFSCDSEVGVDLEDVRVLPDADDVAERMFSRLESATYSVLPPRDKPLGFFNCWTRKEAFIKALGEGLSHALDRFDVSLAPGDAARILRVDATPGERCGWTLSSFSPAPGLVGAVVTRTRNLETA
ncbi:MAG: 4'-phosphopantetheinyl transferase superfamily protein [Vicinamibacterales bacterium]